jgi:hypothetical protein
MIASGLWEGGRTISTYQFAYWTDPPPVCKPGNYAVGMKLMTAWKAHYAAFTINVFLEADHAFT